MKAQGVRILSKNAEKSRNDEKKFQSGKDILELAGSTQEVLAGIQSGRFHVEGRTQRTLSGILVRSKSEVIVADTLTYLEIPFLYEAEARLLDADGKEIVLHPDSTILCPDGTVLCWEHLGLLLQDEDYAGSFAKKLYLFHRNGFTIGRNLIVTADDRRGRIDSLQIRELAERLILPHFA